jgi:hypothetical protein
MRRRRHTRRPCLCLACLLSYALSQAYTPQPKQKQKQGFGSKFERNLNTEETLIINLDSLLNRLINIKIRVFCCCVLRVACCVLRVYALTVGPDRGFETRGG